MKKLTKYIGLGIAGLGFFFNQEVNAQDLNGGTPWEVTRNTFSPNNIHLQVGKNKLDYRGSGDVNNDEIINQTDANSILGATNIGADIDGDGNPGTSSDKSILQEYLSGNIPYLPGNWYELRTETEKTNWLEKRLRDYSWDEASYPGWYCADHVKQMRLDYNGISNVEEYIQHEHIGGKRDLSGEKNGQENIPFHYFSTIHTITGEGHGVGGVLVGNNPLNFDDWYFVDYATLKRIYPGDDAMDKNKPVEINSTVYAEDPNFPDVFPINFYQVADMIAWNLENGNATLRHVDNGVITDNPNDDIVTLSNLSNKTINYQPSLNLEPSQTGEPMVTVSNYPLEAILTHEDGNITPLNTHIPKSSLYV